MSDDNFRSRFDCRTKQTPTGASKDDLLFIERYIIMVRRSMSIPTDLKEQALAELQQAKKTGKVTFHSPCSNFTFSCWRRFPQILTRRKVSQDVVDKLRAVADSLRDAIGHLKTE
jgi:hypothetical protein